MNKVEYLTEQSNFNKQLNLIVQGVNDIIKNNEAEIVLTDDDFDYIRKTLLQDQEFQYLLSMYPESKPSENLEENEIPVEESYTFELIYHWLYLKSYKRDPSSELLKDRFGSAFFDDNGQFHRGKSIKSITQNQPYIFSETEPKSKREYSKVNHIDNYGYNIYLSQEDVSRGHRQMAAEFAKTIKRILSLKKTFGESTLAESDENLKIRYIEEEFLELMEIFNLGIESIDITRLARDFLQYVNERDITLTFNNTKLYLTDRLLLLASQWSVAHRGPRATESENTERNFEIFKEYVLHDEAAIIVGKRHDVGNKSVSKIINTYKRGILESLKQDYGNSEH